MLRSRGEIVLEALDHADAVDAAEALTSLDGRSCVFQSVDCR